MSNPSIIARHYARIINLWPKDALRPEQPFTKAIEYRGAPYGLEPESPTLPDSSKSKAVNTTAVDTKAELANVNALYSLLENRYSKRYPISPRLLKPQSNPDHYDRLMEEIERAPTKTWLQAKLDEWKMKIRWQ